MMKTDIEIAQECTMEPITEVAERAGIPEEYLEQYGKYKAKIDYNFLKKSDKKDGKLILVTAINPTPAGEGKTTTTVGLADALQRMLDYNYQIWTGNHMLDMILNQKEKEAEKQKTQMQISTEVFTTLPFSDREIISLFGNLLDNALEACEQIKEGERWIHIKMKKKNQLLYIEIVNAAKNTGIQTDENFVSKKKDGVLHGYGMKNIRDIVEQYNGMFQCLSLIHI